MEEAILLTSVGQTRPRPHPSLRLAMAGRSELSPGQPERLFQSPLNQYYGKEN